MIGTFKDQQSAIDAGKRQIVALCKIAGRSHLASELLAKGFTVERAHRHLSNLAAADSRRFSVNAKTDTTRTVAGVFEMLDRQAKQLVYAGTTGKTKHQHFAEMLMHSPEGRAAIGTLVGSR